MTAMFYTLLLVSIFFISCRADEAVIQAPFDESGSQAPFDDAATEASFDELENAETKLDLSLLPPPTDEDRLDKRELLIGIAQNHQNHLVSRLEKVAEKMGTHFKHNPNLKDCKALKKAGHTTSGVYTIKPGKKQVKVYCEQKLRRGGWTVFQRRINGSEDFNRGWDEFKKGFGSAAGEYWLGNDHLYALTSNRKTQLLVELQNNNNKIRYARYTKFSVQDESNQYRLQVSGYTSGNKIGDSLSSHSGSSFSTRDRDNDLSFFKYAQLFKSAWWYGNGANSYLNTPYDVANKKGFMGWSTWGVTYFRGARLMVKATKPI